METETAHSTLEILNVRNWKINSLYIHENKQRKKSKWFVRFVELKRLTIQHTSSRALTAILYLSKTSQLPRLERLSLSKELMTHDEDDVTPRQVIFKGINIFSVDNTSKEEITLLCCFLR